MIGNTRNWSNDTTENQKEKKRPVLILMQEESEAWLSSVYIIKKQIWKVYIPGIRYDH